MKMDQNSSKFNALRQAAPVTSWFIATPSMITYLYISAMNSILPSYEPTDLSRGALPAGDHRFCMFLHQTLPIYGFTMT